MSKMVMCDACGRLVHTDSRSDKGAMHEILLNGQECYNLCNGCIDTMFKMIFHAKEGAEYGRFIIPMPHPWMPNEEGNGLC